MSTPAIERVDLPNGLRLILIDLPHFHSLTNFLVFRAGSRYENSTNNGVSHFLEHLVFKGTKNLPEARTVAEFIESIGGQFNAWTSQDYTGYFNVVPASQWQRGLTLPLELAFRPLLRSNDVERERGVIIEEIRQSEDDPAGSVWDLAQSATFANHPLAMPVLGTNQTVSELSHQALTEYHQRLYRPSRAYFVSVGNLAGKNIAADITRQLADLAFDQNDEQPPLFSGPGQANLKVKNKATDQTHLVLNTIEPKFALSDRHDSYVGVVLNAVLGAGMSSRLFTHIREQKGLAYAVGSTLGHYEDTGTLSVYAGLNTEKIGAALLAIEEEFQKLQAEPVGEAELNKAQELVCGHYDLSADQPLQLANWYGTNQLLGMRESYDEAKTIVRAVTAAEIQKMAQRLFQKNKLSLAVIGPFQSEQLFADFLGLPHSSTIK